ncbi:hypothetical protein Ocin01_12965 [Orchesella cincta]|uniref:Coiled-coil domain-containing protein 112 n=1 Tax=Orchesella cincta TaxID=48709 RepID=A0A1D2MKZ7_ORCCI|nr:hypothetical protein Ocin01_12965 [Orchesella cincta]
MGERSRPVPRRESSEQRRVYASFGFPRGELIPHELEDDSDRLAESLEEKLANLGIELGNIERMGGGTYQSVVVQSGSGRSSVQPSPRRREDSDFSRESSDLSARLGEARSARLEVDISRRISGVSNSMEQYDKAVVSYRKSVQDIRRRRSKNEISRSPSPEAPQKGKSKSTASIVESLGSPRKVFGLDASSILESSSSSSQNEEEGSSSSDEDTDAGEAAMRVSIKQGAAARALAKSNQAKKKPPVGQRQRYPGRGTKGKKVGQDEKVRSLSPIMPEVTDKKFQTILERREERVSRQLSSMKNELAQLNQKVEMDRRRASTATPASSTGNSTPGKRRGKTDTSYKGRPLRLMKISDSEQLNELSEFLQSNGGKAGGWERRDHNVFLKHFQTWRNHPHKLMEVLRKELPNKKNKEIATHVKWFEKFEELQKKNKLQVHQWSIEKRRENEMVFEMGSEINRAKIEGEKRRQEHLRHVREQEKDKGKEKLAQWKQRRNDKEKDNNKDNLDVAGVRQHILDITAKVHALDNPKRDFRPPRAPSSAARQSSRTSTAGGGGRRENRLPEVEPDRSLSRPGSSSKSKPFPQRKSMRESMSMSQFQERDGRLVEARRKAVQIARERRKSHLSEVSAALTAEQVRKRAHAQAQLQSSMTNPTKLSEMRKSLTHLERLEALSKQAADG